MSIAHNPTYQFYKYRLWQLWSAPYFLVTTSKPGWRFINRKALTLYSQNPPSLDGVGERIVEELNENGIAITHLEELFGDVHLLTHLQHVAQELFNQRLLTNPKKTFLVYFLRSDKEPVPLENPFLTLALEPKILGIISAYLGVFPRLRFLSGNVAIPVSDGTDPEGSQRWHRDPGVQKICKIFLYLNDVDEVTGPFTAIAATQPGGRLSNVLPHRFFGQGSYYPKPGEVERALKARRAEANVQACAARAGTVIFCNTRALHRGGYATEKERSMVTAYYEVSASEEPPETRFSNFEGEIETLPALVQYAMR